ncbi:hypothetical protein ACH50O_15710 [Methylomonas sp. 2BW1-5-20]|uniref:hypothetical protein n=1 Tax=Methylomonas sp. 2BW1-5-20 TaxID=3376686 RepID=UPI00404D221E
MNAEHIVGLTYADRLRMATEARHLGIRERLDSDLAALTSLMGPMTEGPEWPAGAAWLAARRDRHAVLMSDGLSDPWVERDRPETGLGLEVFIESPDSGIGSDAPLAALADTWLFPLTAEVSHTLAGYSRLCERLLNGELLSLEFNIDHIKDGRGRIGALLGVPAVPDRPLSLPGGEIRLVAITILTGAELRYLRGKGELARHELADQLKTAGVNHLSLLHRPSLV